ncbi:MAG: hypothetical protein QG622_2095 [Actinomycetota bacterium]|nr:hypothetical protein [Actinomycetota bacterium]
MRFGLRGRGRTIAAAACFVAVLGPLLQVRYGYQAGINDHIVLSLQGFQWALPGFAVDDWFIASAPQPHVLFDVVTWAGAATGRIAEFYFAWWLLGIVVAGIATAVLATAWAPGHPVRASAAVAVLIGLGPELILGSTSPALPTALPHELGGFLAYLTAALLLTRRPRAAAAVLVATAAVHVQIGALSIVVSLLAILVVEIFEKVRWWSVTVGAVVAGAIVVTILRARPVAAESDDFVEICREVIPYHCDTTTWSAATLWAGAAVVVAALLCLAYVVRDGRTTIGLYVATVAVPALGLVLGVTANRFGIPVAGRLAQSTNIFRLSVLLVPFSAWGLYAGFVRMRRVRSKLVWLIPAVPAGYGWFVPRTAVTALPNAPHVAGALLGLAAAAVLLKTLPESLPKRFRRFLPTWSGAVAGTATGLAAAGVLAYGVVRMGTVQARPLDITFVPSGRHHELGELVARHVPVGEEIVVPPTLGVIRLLSGRSIFVDCKSVPYGGAAWREYRDRMGSLGGRGSCSRGGRPFVEVPPERLSSVALSYGARYLMLGEKDRRVRTLRADLGWRALATPDDGPTGMWLLAAPGAADAASGAYLP